MTEYERILRRMRYFEHPYSEIKEMLKRWWNEKKIDEEEYLRLRTMACRDCEL